MWNVRSRHSSRCSIAHFVKCGTNAPPGTLAREGSPQGAGAGRRATLAGGGILAVILFGAPCFSRRPLHVGHGEPLGKVGVARERLGVSRAAQYQPPARSAWTQSPRDARRVSSHLRRHAAVRRWPPHSPAPRSLHVSVTMHDGMCRPHIPRHGTAQIRDASACKHAAKRIRPLQDSPAWWPIPTRSNAGRERRMRRMAKPSRSVKLRG